jgi:Tfp pilus assembly protein PilN
MALPDTIDVSGVKLNADEAMSIVSLAGMTAFYRKAINLLPHEYRQEKAEFIEKVSLRALASVLIVVLWVSFFFTKVKIDDYERRIKTAPYQLDAVNQIKELRARVLERESFMSSIQASEVQMEYIMKELSNIVPSNVVFDELVINKKAKTLDIKGIFYGPNSSAQTVLAKFMEEIERSKYFKEAQLASLHAAASAGRETSNFSINCLLE